MRPRKNGTVPLGLTCRRPSPERLRTSAIEARLTPNNPNAPRHAGGGRKRRCVAAAFVYSEMQTDWTKVLLRENPFTQCDSDGCRALVPAAGRASRACPWAWRVLSTSISRHINPRPSGTMCGTASHRPKFLGSVPACKGTTKKACFRLRQSEPTEFGSPLVWRPASGNNSRTDGGGSPVRRCFPREAVALKIQA